MRKKTGNAYFEKLWKEMISHFETFLKTGGQAELHKFRVSIKKLKSLLVLFESGRKRGSLLKRFKPVQKVFKKAGDIRNAQINLQLSEKFDIRDDVFAEQQRQVASKGISEFQQNRKKFKRNLRDCHKDILSHLDPPNRSTIRKFYRTNLERINSFLAEPQFDEALHSCRKRIKFLLYNHNAANKMLKKEVKLDTAYLERLQEKIGNWHDNIMIIELLSPRKTEDNSLVSRLKSENEKLEIAIRDEGGEFGYKAARPEPEVMKII
jgi:CHAD domain-containing protein